MNWDEIFQLHAWTSLSDLKFENFELVAENLYKVGGQIYLRTQVHNKALELGDPRAPFVTVAYWSPYMNGVKRVVLGDPFIKVEEPLATPPSEISFGTTGRYFELIRKASSDRKKIIERATYSNEGLFLKKSITIDRFEYCFINNEEKDEKTFLIKVSLLK